ncbi:hypothetical protein D1007_27690 [Hordeum vulgare]|nr:hypothetical protein D1007_27690 [Hordeum vulgare]
MSSNLVGCFNDVLKGARSLPVTAIVEYTFFKLNEYFQRHLEETIKWIGEKMDYLEKVDEWLELQASKSSQQQIITFDRTEMKYQIDELGGTTRDGHSYGGAAFEVHLKTWCFLCERPNPLLKVETKGRRRTKRFKGDMDDLDARMNQFGSGHFMEAPDTINCGGMASSGSMTRQSCVDRDDMPKMWREAKLDKIKEKDVPTPPCWCGDVCKSPPPLCKYFNWIDHEVQERIEEDQYRDCMSRQHLFNEYSAHVEEREHHEKEKKEQKKREEERKRKEKEAR